MLGAVEEFEAGEEGEVGDGTGRLSSSMRKSRLPSLFARLIMGSGGTISASLDEARSRVVILRAGDDLPSAISDPQQHSRNTGWF